MKKIIAILLCLALVLGLAGCTTLDNFKNAIYGKVEEDVNEIVIGVYEPLSGEYKAQGELEVMGIELAHETFSKILGRPVKLVYADNKSNIDDAKSAIKALCGQEPLVVLGSYGEAITMVAGDELNASNIPGITITSTNPLLIMNNPYCFCATYSDEMQGFKLAEYATTELGLKNLATVKVAGDDSTSALVQRFADKAKAQTKYTTNQWSIQSDATDFSALISRLKESHTEAVFVALSDAKGQQFIKACIDADFTDIVFMATRSWNNDNMKSFIESYEGIKLVVCADNVAESDDNGVAKVFLQSFKEKYGADAEPSSATIVAYDAYLLALDAIDRAYNYVKNTSMDELLQDAKSEPERVALKTMYEKIIEAGAPTSKVVRDQLKATLNFMGASGLISYTESNAATKEINIDVIYKEPEPVHIEGTGEWVDGVWYDYDLVEGEYVKPADFPVATSTNQVETPEVSNLLG